MSASASRTKSTRANPGAKRQVLPPARALAKPSRAAAPTLVRIGAKPKHQAQRFALPKGFRRSDPANYLSAAPRFTASPEPPPRNDSIISATGLLEALHSLPQREAASERRPLAIDLHPWSYPDAEKDTSFQRDRTKDGTPSAVIHFAQLPLNQVIAPPVHPLRRPLGKAVTTHSLRRFDSTAITSTGAPLPVAVRNSLARTFAVDLTPIRVHTDASAQRVVRRLSTRAFAYGNHIFLGPGEQPGDLRLMAHEVAHVVQQASGVTSQHFTEKLGDTLEHEAERASTAAIRGERFNVQQG